MSNLKKATFRPIIFEVMQFDGTITGAREIFEWVIETLGEQDEKWTVEFKTELHGEPTLYLESKTTTLRLFKDDWLTFVDDRFEVSDEQTFNRLFHISEGE